MSADPNYGDLFRAWVSESGRAHSEALTRSDYRLRIRNAMVTAHQRARQGSDEAIVRLEAIHAEIERFESALPTDPVLAAVGRKASAQQHLNSLFEVRAWLEESESQLAELERIQEPAAFHRDQLYHVGREGVLESLVAQGDALSQNLRGHYPIEIHATFHADGRVSYEPHSIESAAISLALHLSGPYAVAVLAVAGIYYLIRDRNLQRKYDEQDAKIRAALIEFGRLALTPTESYGVYEQELERQKDHFEQTSGQIRQVLDATTRAWTEVFSTTLTRLKAANQILTEAKLRLLAADQDMLARIHDLKLTPHLLATSMEINLFNRDINRLRRLAAEPSDEFHKLAGIEELEDAVEEARVVYWNLVRDPAFSSLHAALRRHISRLEGYRREIELHREKSVEFGVNHIPLCSATAELEITPVDSPAAMDDRELESASDIRSFFLNLHAHHISVDAGVPSHPYEESLAGRGLRVSVVFGGLWDGGLAEDRRRAERDIGAMQANLGSRMIHMDENFDQLTPAIETWIARNREVSAKQTELLVDRAARANSLRETMLTANASALGAAAATIQQFAVRPFGQQDVEHTLNVLRATSDVRQHVPAYHIRSTGPDFTVFPIRGDAFSAATEVGRQIEASQKKVDRSIETTLDRVTRNSVRGTGDPVFASMDDAERWETDLRARQALAATFLDPESSARIRIGGAAASAGQRLLEDVQALRFFAEGLSSNYPAFGGLLEFERKFDERVDAFLADAGSWDAPYACNRFVSEALEEVFGFDDFVHPDPEVLRKMGITARITALDANQMFEYMSLSPKFHRLGTATSQKVLDEAAHLAAQRLPVIVARKGVPHGHVAFVRAGVPINTSTTWRSRNPEWGELRLPMLSSLALGSEADSFRYKFMSFAFREPTEVTFFVRSWR